MHGLWLFMCSSARPAWGRLPELRGTPPRVSIFWLAGWGEKVRGSAGRCWTSPGEHDICERLGCGEEGKDDPVHHPLHLKGGRACRPRRQGSTRNPPLPVNYAGGAGREGHSGLQLGLPSHQGWGKGQTRTSFETGSQC